MTFHPGRLGSSWRTGPQARLQEEGSVDQLTGDQGEMYGRFGVLSLGLLPSKLEGEGEKVSWDQTGGLEESCSFGTLGGGAKSVGEGAGGLCVSGGRLWGSPEGHS